MATQRASRHLTPVTIDRRWESLMGEDGASAQDRWGRFQAVLEELWLGLTLEPHKAGGDYSAEFWAVAEEIHDHLRSTMVRRASEALHVSPASAWGDPLAAMGQRPA